MTLHVDFLLPVSSHYLPSTPYVAARQLVMSVSTQVVRPVLTVRHLYDGPPDRRGRCSHFWGSLGRCCLCPSLSPPPRPVLCLSLGPEGPPGPRTAGSYSSGSALMVCCGFAVAWRSRDWTLRYHLQTCWWLRLQW